MFSWSLATASAAQMHSVFVHFPIALWMVALLLWILSGVAEMDELFTFGRWLLYLASAAAIIALATGFVASADSGHDRSGHDLIYLHRNLMIAASIIGVATASVAFVLRYQMNQLKRWLFTLSLVVTVAVAVVGADRGGQLVYVHGVGTAPAAGKTYVGPGIQYADSPH